MTEIYAFLFSLVLGFFARVLYLGESALSKRTNLIPVTVALDILTAAAIGGAFIAYVILCDVVLAPYLFAALAAGYFIAFAFTRKKPTHSA